MPRITYREDQEALEMQEAEKLLDEKRCEEELEILGSIGFKNAKEPYLKYPEAIAKIDQMCKDLCQKLYTGENAHFLVGPDKIPAYLTIFLEKMKRQAEEFKINQVRQLRTSAERFQEMCSSVPYSVFAYLKTVYTHKIESDVRSKETAYDRQKAALFQKKEENLRMFRPNLSNPANKQATADLNQAENDRSQQFKDVSNSCL